MVTKVLCGMLIVVFTNVRVVLLLPKSHIFPSCSSSGYDHLQHAGQAEAPSRERDGRDGGGGQRTACGPARVSVTAGDTRNADVVLCQLQNKGYKEKTGRNSNTKRKKLQKWCHLCWPGVVQTCFTGAIIHCPVFDLLLSIVHIKINVWFIFVYLDHTTL